MCDTLYWYPMQCIYIRWTKWLKWLFWLRLNHNHKNDVDKTEERECRPKSGEITYNIYCVIYYKRRHKVEICVKYAFNTCQIFSWY